MDAPIVKVGIVTISRDLADTDAPANRNIQSR